MLEVIGGDCAGALSLFPAGMPPPVPDDKGVEVIDPARVELLEQCIQN